MTFQWDARRGLSFNNVYRADPDTIQAWSRRNEVVSHACIQSHQSNPLHVDRTLWWVAQLKLHGLDFDTSINSKQAKAKFRQWIKQHGSVKITKKILKKEVRKRREGEAAVADAQDDTEVSQTVTTRHSHSTLQPANANKVDGRTLKRSAESDIQPPQKRVRVSGFTTINSAVAEVGQLSLGDDDQQLELTPRGADSNTGLSVKKVERLVKVSPEDVKFMEAGEEAWLVQWEFESVRYAVRDNDNIDYMINDWLCENVSTLDDHTYLASRWLDSDQPLSFYDAQLKVRNIPTTKSKEVAKWRLKTAKRDSNTKHMSPKLTSIFDQLEDILNSVMFDLCRGNLTHDFRLVTRGINDIPLAPDAIISEKRSKTSRRTPRYSWEIGDVETWMEEEPDPALVVQDVRETAVRRWMEIRSYPVLPAETETLERTTPDRCSQCHQKLRFCRCDSCRRCGELITDCKCNVCGICGEGVPQSCVCLECDRCEIKFNPGTETGLNHCFCYCDVCGVMFDFQKSPAEACGCKLDSVLAATQRALDLDKKRMKHVGGVDKHTRMSWFASNMIRWRPKHKSIQSGLHFHLLEICVKDICGTYELVTTDPLVRKSAESCEIVISASDGALYGRFRIGVDVHGLFRTKQIPSYASTEIVQCRCLVENFDTKEGKWWLSEGATKMGYGDDSDGIMFLGNGLVKLSPRLFTHRITKLLDGVLLGVKTSEYCEDNDAMKESWQAIYRAARGHAKTENNSTWRECIATPLGPWNEYEVDQLVNQLSGYRGPARRLHKGKGFPKQMDRNEKREQRRTTEPGRVANGMIAPAKDL